jgi:Protein of unknown function (DUF3467)
MTKETKKQLEAQSESQSAIERRTPEWVPSPDGIREVYTNFIYANWGPFDVRLRFGQLVPGPQASPWVIEERAAVTMAWPHAKILRDLLIDLVKRYEDTNGEIKPLALPPGG